MIYFITDRRLAGIKQSLNPSRPEIEAIVREIIQWRHRDKVRSGPLTDPSASDAKAQENSDAVESTT